MPTPNKHQEILDCKTCGHYSLYKMLMSNEPWGYTGELPCLRCFRYQKPNDEHTNSIGGR
jgi:hypothetical protein